MAELSVQIGANIKDLQNKLATAIQELDGLKLKQKELNALFKAGAISADKYYSDVAKNSTQLKKASSNVNNLQNEINDLGKKGFTPLNKDVANAVPTLTSFSQVIQDAPYGIRGVANNITQLTSQFGYLSKSTGGSVGALKAMLGTLTGPAGILLAVSAVTSLLVSYGDEIGNIISGNSELAASQKAVNEELNKFYGGTVTTISSYVSILEDVNTSEKERLRITDELIKEVPNLTKADFAYGTNLDIVKAKIGQYVLAQASRIEADTLVQENADKLAKKARLQAIVDANKIKKTKQGSFTVFEVNKEGAKELRNYLKEIGVITTEFRSNVLTEVSDVDLFEKAKKELSALDKSLKPLQDKINDLYGVSFNGGLDKADDTATGAFKELLKKQEELKKKYGDLLVTQGASATETKAVAEEYKNLSIRINEVKKALDTTGKKPKKDISKEAAEKRRVLLLGIEQDLNDEIFNDAAKTAKEVQAIYAIYADKIAAKADNTDLINEARVFKQIEDIANKIQEIQKKFPEFKFSEVDFAGMDLSKLDEMALKLQNLQNQGKLFSDVLGNAFGTLTSKIASSIETGNILIDAFAQAIIQSLSNIGIALLQSLVLEKIIGGAKKAIDFGKAQSSAIVIGTNAAAAAGPAGLAVLPATIGAAIATVTGAFAGIAAFAKGGFSGDNNLAYLNRNEVVLRPFEQSMFLNAVRGVGVPSYSDNDNYQDNASMAFILRGTDQMVQTNRAKRKYNRFNG